VIDCIHKHVSGHSEADICEEEEGAEVGEDFLRRVDAAFVSKNTSSGFANVHCFGVGTVRGRSIIYFLLLSPSLSSLLSLSTASDLSVGGSLFHLSLFPGVLLLLIPF